jgi:hypothetical protein
MLKQIIFKIDDKREHIEDFIASNVLAKWDNFSKADDVRIAVNMALINFVIAYAESQGLPCECMSQEVRQKLAKAGAKVEKKLNALLQKQLQKKSKMYKERHNV